MKLPLNPPTINLDDPQSNQAIWTLVKTVLKQDLDLFQPKHVRLSPSSKKLLIRLEDQGILVEHLEQLQVDKEALLKIDTGDQVRGVIVTMQGPKGSKYDFISRYFAPWVGIPEDPVTGSAHTVLTPYWVQELDCKVNLFARQCSPRNGELKLSLKSDHIVVSGQGTIVLEGFIHV